MVKEHRKESRAISGETYYLSLWILFPNNEVSRSAILDPRRHLLAAM